MRVGNGLVGWLVGPQLHYNWVFDVVQVWAQQGVSVAWPQLFLLELILMKLIVVLQQILLFQPHLVEPPLRC